MKSIPWKTLFFSLLPAVLLVGCGELACRWYYTSRPNYWAHRDRLVNPAYTSKPWFSEQFLTECFQQYYFLLPGTPLIFPTDIANDYFHVVRAVRQTTGFQWKAGEKFKRLFLIGGSTTYCAEVPDELTWPSRLQQRLGARWKVFNYGVTSYMSDQELARLKFEFADGNIPDACIFYDGVNEVGQGVYNGKPQTDLFQTEKDFRAGWRYRLKNSLYLFKFFSSLPRPRRTKVLDNPTQFQKLCQLAAQLYESRILEAKALCDRYHCRFFVFLQPNLYTLGRPFNAYEKAVNEEVEKTNPGMQECVQGLYPLLRQKIKAMRARGIEAYDISDTFSPNQKPIFLDWCHVESDGNEFIAEKIASFVKPRLSPLYDSSQN